MNTFFGKSALVRRSTFEQTFAKIHSFIFPTFFFAKAPSLKVYENFLGRRLFSLQQFNNSATIIYRSFKGVNKGGL